MQDGHHGESKTGPGVVGTTTATASVAANTSLLALQKKITELELALSQCQKATEIPTVELMTHPDIARALTGAGSGVDVNRMDLEELGLEAQASHTTGRSIVALPVHQRLPDFVLFPSIAT